MTGEEKNDRPDWWDESMEIMEQARDELPEGGPPCICDGDNVALQVLCRAFDDDPSDLMEEWRAFDKSGWFWWGRALGAFIRTKLLALLPTEGEPVAWRYRMSPAGRWTYRGCRTLMDHYPDGFEQQPLFTTPQESAEVEAPVSTRGRSGQAGASATRSRGRGREAAGADGGRRGGHGGKLPL